MSFQPLGFRPGADERAPRDANLTRGIIKMFREDKGGRARALSVRVFTRARGRAGFGFILRLDGEHDVFFHISCVPLRPPSLSRAACVCACAQAGEGQRDAGQRRPRGVHGGGRRTRAHVRTHALRAHYACTHTHTHVGTRMYTRM